MSEPTLTDPATRERLLAVCEAATVVGSFRDLSALAMATRDPHTGYEAALRLIGELQEAILDFLKWENEEEHNEAEWLEATEKLASAAEEKTDD